MLTVNPVDFVTPPRIERQEMLVLDEAQTVLLLEYARPTRLYVPVLLSVTTGMRRGEVLGLRWGDIEQSRLAVRRSLEQVKAGLNFKSPKNGKARVIHLPHLTAEVLKRHRIEQAERRLRLGPGYHDQNLICPRQDGDPWPPNLLSRNFCDFIKRHPDLPQIRFHDLRHTFATLSLTKAIHPKVVSEALGHSTIAITLDLYSHVLPSLAAEAAAIFDEILPCWVSEITGG
jgi:integrase